MNILKILIFFLLIHCAATTLLIAIEFFLDLGNGEVTEAIVLVGDLLRVTPRRGTRNPLKYQQKIDKLSRRLAEGRITSEKFFDKVAPYIGSINVEKPSKVLPFFNEALAFAGDRAISDKYIKWQQAQKRGNEGRMPNKTPTDKELMDVLNNVFTLKDTKGEKTKITLYHGVAYATQGGQLKKFTECRNWFDSILNCWRSSDIDDGRDFVQGLPVPHRSRIDAAGYGAESRALRTALSQYFNTKDRLTKTMDELRADITNAYAQVYEIQKNLGTFFTSRSFSGLVMNKQNGQSVQTELDFYDPEEFPPAADEQLASMEAKEKVKNAEENPLEDEEFDPLPGPSESDAMRRLNEATRSRIAAEAANLANFAEKFPNVPREKPSAPPLATAEEFSEAEDVVERVVELAKQPSKVAVAEEIVQQRGWFIRLASALKEFVRMFPRG